MVLYGYFPYWISSIIFHVGYIAFRSCWKISIQIAGFVHLIYIYIIYTHHLRAYHTYTYIHTYIHSFIHSYIHTYIHTFIHSYIHTYIHTYIYIYTYIYTCVYFPYWRKTSHQLLDACHPHEIPNHDILMRTKNMATVASVESSSGPRCKLHLMTHVTTRNPDFEPIRMVRSPIFFTFPSSAIFSESLLVDIPSIIPNVNPRSTNHVYSYQIVILYMIFGTSI